MEKKTTVSGNADLGSSASEGIVWNDGQVAVIERLQNINTGYRMMKADVYAVVLCREGRGTFYVDNRKQEIAKNNLLVCPPNVILENGMFSVDFECCGFIFSSEYVRSLNIVFGATWDVQKLIEKMPVLPLTGEEAATFMQYYALLRDKFMEQPHKYRKELIGGILQAFTCEFFRMQERLIPRVSLSATSVKVSESLFQRFVNMISASYPKQRRVTFYADKLCVCPKYLSAVCKQQSGMTASDMIDRFILKDIEFLLKQHGKSIKEIAEELNFPNISFFGKYVKSQVGMPPRRYRDMLFGRTATEKPG